MLKPDEPTCDLEPEAPPVQLGRLEVSIIDEEEALLELARIDPAGRRVWAVTIDAGELVRLMLELGFAGELAPVRKDAP